MAISEAFANTATISTTEFYLASNSTTKTDQTDDGIYQLWLKLDALTTADSFRVRLYERVLSGDTTAGAAEWSVTGDATNPRSPSPTFILLHGWEFSLQKITGTDRSISWSIRKVA